MHLLIFSSLALATSSGKVGVSTTGCGSCHGSSADSSTTVTFDPDTTTVSPGDTLSIRLLVATTNARRTGGGLDVSASGGTFASGSNTRVSFGEITHRSSTAMTSGEVSFDFTWTAPSTEGTYTLYAAGNAVDNNRSDSGDGWNLAPNLTLTVACQDLDGDGVTGCDGDCDDDDAAISPDADEECDGIDNNCDGSIDGNDAVDRTTWYQDNDGDGFGDAAHTRDACNVPSGYVANFDDCDDTDRAVNPDATEVCDSANTDEDCDGNADDADDAPTGRTSWYADSDGDGYGAGVAVQACDAPTGYRAYAGDCDDTDAAYNPAATETCGDERDLNCDGSVGTIDTDGDGFYACEECDDGDSSVFPGQTESCNDVDDDCDGSIDEGEATGATTWYADTDEDGHGDPASALDRCDQPEGYTSLGDDCDDGDGESFPGAREVWYDGTDQDCDGASDYDADRDGYESADYAGDDCDDDDATVNPGATEIWYDGLDQNCDGASDDDADADGHDAVAAGGDDCDDADPGVSPSATELWYDGVDQDCDGNDDDQDGDGSPQADDCDDTDATLAADCGGDTGGDDNGGTEDPDKDDATGCGCATTSSSTDAPIRGSLLTAGLMGLLALLRRRR